MKLTFFRKYPIYEVHYTVKRERPSPVTPESEMPLKYAIAIAVVAGTVKEKLPYLLKEHLKFKEGLSSLLQEHLKNTRGIVELCRNAPVEIMSYHNTGFKSDKIGVISTEYSKEWLEHPYLVVHPSP